MENKKDGFGSFLKFAALGLAGIAVSMGLTFKDDLVNTYERSGIFSDVVVSLKAEIEKGIGSNSFNNKKIEIKTGVEYQNKKNIWGSYATDDDIQSGLCTVMLTAGGTVGKMIEVGSIPGAKEEDLKIINSMITLGPDITMAVEMVGHHEVFHCDENVLGENKRFNIPNRPELTVALNALYVGGTVSYTPAMYSLNDKETLLMSGNLDTLISEGYAESASSITMVNKYGEDALQILSHRQSLTGSNRVVLMDLNKHWLPKHTTDGINDYFRTPEGIKDAQSLTSLTQLRERSLEVANTNMLQALKSRDNLNQLLNDRYWNTETINYWKTDVVAKKLNLPQGLSKLMQDRVAELKSKLPQELQDKFAEAVMIEKDGARHSQLKAFAVYKEVLEKFPELTAGAKEIKTIQEQLPKAVNDVKANHLYSLKTVKDVIDSSGANLKETLKVEVKPKRALDASENLSESKKLKI